MLLDKANTIYDDEDALVSVDENAGQLNDDLTETADAATEDDLSADLDRDLEQDWSETDEVSADLFFEEEGDYNVDSLIEDDAPTKRTHKTPAWQILERRREEMALQRELRDDLFDF